MNSDTWSDRVKEEEVSVGRGREGLIREGRGRDRFVEKTRKESDWKEATHYYESVEWWIWFPFWILCFYSHFSSPRSYFLLLFLFYPEPDPDRECQFQALLAFERFLALVASITNFGKVFQFQFATWLRVFGLGCGGFFFKVTLYFKYKSHL